MCIYTVIFLSAFSGHAHCLVSTTDTLLLLLVVNSQFYACSVTVMVPGTGIFMCIECHYVCSSQQMYLREVDGDVFEQADHNCYPQCTFLTFGIRPRRRGTVLSSNLMIGYLCIFDRENRRIGFAVSTCNCEYQVCVASKLTYYIYIIILMCYYYLHAYIIIYVGVEFLLNQCIYDWYRCV